MKRIITALLAAQLFVTAALCAGVCCVSDLMDSVSANALEAHSQTSKTEPAMESGHCHGKKQSRSKPKNVVKISASHHNCHSAKSSTANNARVCACAVKREEQPAGLLPARNSESSSLIRDLLIAESPPDWCIEASPPQTISPQPLRAHSPPTSSARLNLRI